MQVKDTFYVNKASLQEYFGDKKLLTATEVSKYFGIDVRTVRKYYFKNIKGPYISIDSLARLLAINV